MDEQAPRLSIRFWGTRGSIPAPGPDTARYGGETSSMEVMVGGRRILIDCGSGIRHLGQKLCALKDTDIDLLLTHCHLDHVCGFPFFGPAYMPDSAVRLWAGHLDDAAAIADTMARVMSPPVFPVAIDELKGCSCTWFRPGDTLAVAGTQVRTIALNHPNGACGYRFDHEGAALAIITDHEHGNDEIDAAVERFVEGVDVMVYDGMFDDAEYEKHVGWGHSTWQEGIGLAERAGIAQPVIFHHHPDRSDEALDRLAERARARLTGAHFAAQGLVIAL